MTRKEAIEWLEAIEYDYDISKFERQAIDMAIEALKREDKFLYELKNNSCSEKPNSLITEHFLDVISRQDAIETVVEKAEKQHNMLYVEDVEDILGFLPSAEKTGEWLEKNVMEEDDARMIEEWQEARCSKCGKYHTTPYAYYFKEYAFCPNCGARMVGDE